MVITGFSGDLVRKLLLGEHLIGLRFGCV